MSERDWADDAADEIWGVFTRRGFDDPQLVREYLVAKLRLINCEGKGQGLAEAVEVIRGKPK